MKGETPDISHICEHAWYDWVMFRDGPAQFPEHDLVLGRYLGPTRDVGSMMTAKILKANGEIVPRSTYRALTPHELESDVHKQARQRFDTSAHEALGRAATTADFDEDELTPEWDRYEPIDGEEGTPDAPDEELEPTPEVGDNYVGVDIMLPRGSTMARGRVIGRKHDADGNVIGRANDNAVLDTREYRVEFADGEVTELTANVIAENMYAQCDQDGNQYVLLDDIVDFRKNGDAISLADQKTTDPRGRSYLRRTTVGWQLCCEWKDGSTSWEKLSDLKESHPVVTAEYAVRQGISHEPAFNYWVPHVLKKRDRIISLVRQRKTRYLKRNQKFGIELPKTVKEALDLDQKNGNTLWADAIAKEMKVVRIAFDILPDGSTVPKGYEFMKCHLIFDIKMED
ncbi:hypothetical protein ACHAXR_000992, partial [Thalassiosira sp. AJA248-18]